MNLFMENCFCRSVCNNFASPDHKEVLFITFYDPATMNRSVMHFKGGRLQNCLGP